MAVNRARLEKVAPALRACLSPDARVSPVASAEAIRRQTVNVAMRDGIQLATDIYLPLVVRAPAVIMRTPYGRAMYSELFVAFAQEGYVVISQDCRGTGDSEPDHWDCYIYECEDSIDCVEWATKQLWFDGFIAGCGGSYVGSTQWAMALHPAMTAIVPEVAGLIVSPADTPNSHMFVNAYARSVGKGIDKVPTPFAELEREMVAATLESGYYNEPMISPLSDGLLRKYPHLRNMPRADAKAWLWYHFRVAPPGARADLVKLALGVTSVTLDSFDALAAVFGRQIPMGLHILPRSDAAELARSVHAPALVLTGWYDWSLGDTLATWQLLQRESEPHVRSRNRLLITPGAHNKPGYHEGEDTHPELRSVLRTQNILPLLLSWYAAIRTEQLESWPNVIYYLMGAYEWRISSAWPPEEARPVALYLGDNSSLTLDAPADAAASDTYTYCLLYTSIEWRARPGRHRSSALQSRCLLR